MVFKYIYWNKVNWYFALICSWGFIKRPPYKSLSYHSTSRSAAQPCRKPGRQSLGSRSWQQPTLDSLTSWYTTHLLIIMLSFSDALYLRIRILWVQTCCPLLEKDQLPSDFSKFSTKCYDSWDFLHNNLVEQGNWGQRWNKNGHELMIIIFKSWGQELLYISLQFCICSKVTN